MGLLTAVRCGLVWMLCGRMHPEGVTVPQEAAVFRCGAGTSSLQRGEKTDTSSDGFKTGALRRKGCKRRQRGGGKSRAAPRRATAGGGAGGRGGAAAAPRSARGGGTGGGPPASPLAPPRRQADGRSLGPRGGGVW